MKILFLLVMLLLLPLHLWLVQKNMPRMVPEFDEIHFE